MTKVYKDKNGRSLFFIKDGKFLVNRHPDMDEETKKLILDICEKLSDLVEDFNKSEMRKFLDYNEDEEFCS